MAFNVYTKFTAWAARHYSGIRFLVPSSNHRGHAHGRPGAHRQRTLKISQRWEITGSDSAGRQDSASCSPKASVNTRQYPGRSCAFVHPADYCDQTGAQVRGLTRGAVLAVTAATAATEPFRYQGGSADVARRDADSVLTPGVGRVFLRLGFPRLPGWGRFRAPRRMFLAPADGGPVMVILLAGVVGERHPRHLRGQHGAVCCTGENDQAASFVGHLTITVAQIPPRAEAPGVRGRAWRGMRRPCELWWLGSVSRWGTGRDGDGSAAMNVHPRWGLRTYLTRSLVTVVQNLVRPSGCRWPGWRESRG
jgi:hypothetical protein